MKMVGGQCRPTKYEPLNIFKTNYRIFEYLFTLKDFEHIFRDNLMGLYLGNIGGITI